MALSQKGEDNVQRSTLTMRDPYELAEEEKPIPAAGEGDDDEHAQGTETCPEPSPAADEDQRSAVTPTTPVVPSTATDSSTPGQDPLDKEAPPSADDIDNDTADQRGSETRRTESSAWGDGPFSPKTSADDIDNDTADQRGSETRRTESSAWGDGPFSPKTFPSWMGRERPTAHRKDDCDFPDQPRTSESKIKRRKSAPKYACNVFGTWSAAAVWIKMALTVATSSLAGAECIGTEVKLDKGEAVLRCPLPVNASATRQGIIVKHFPTPDTAGEVMRCDWPTKEAGKPECESSDGFSLEGQLTDQVVAKVPVSRLMDSGAYKCQLYPLGDHKYFNPCHIHRFSDNDEGKRSAVTPAPEVSSTATNGSTPGQDPLIREAPPCVGQSGSVALTEVVLVLQVIIIILLVGKGRMHEGWMDDVVSVEQFGEEFRDVIGRAIEPPQSVKAGLQQGQRQWNVDITVQTSTSTSDHPSFSSNPHMFRQFTEQHLQLYQNLHKIPKDCFRIQLEIWTFKKCENLVFSLLHLLQCDKILGGRGWMCFAVVNNSRLCTTFMTMICEISFLFVLHYLLFPSSPPAFTTFLWHCGRSSVERQICESAYSWYQMIMMSGMF